ncbi:caax amino protease family protein; putative membrane protein [Staphylococcus piscifermentans]|nr:CPBP family intramembrane glutamic endopeptidase [Staphylococcus piscifermentans]RTX82061.1 CPBP family intramembrane metalloprotease [Staphylococcus piscifermentans]SNV06561.1 caax amino protease family protein; putative membrane protein [Staphylococcus piscifermentans]
MRYNISDNKYKLEGAGDAEMKKMFIKHETLSCILLIVAYVVINSYCIQNFGLADYRSTLINTLISIFLIWLIIKLGRVRYYGLVKVHAPKKYLYFIPLILIATVNLWGGLKINFTVGETLFFILTMINVGFIEELIFRGFLFKMMAKDNLKMAIMVSAVTFGIGHIINLLNGSDLIPTLLQIFYAVALGYLFVIIFYKSKSLVPCIVTHILINVLSIFNANTNNTSYLIPLFIIIVSVCYALYINKKVKVA